MSTVAPRFTLNESSTTLVTPKLASAVREVARQVPGALDVLDAFRIDYATHDGDSLQAACLRAGADPGAVLAALGRAAPGPRDLGPSPSITRVLERLLDHHHPFTRESLARIERLAMRAVALEADAHPEVHPLCDRARALASELLPHLLKEEHVLFPLFRDLERVGSGPLSATSRRRLLSPIRVMLLEHDAAAHLLEDVRLVTQRYTVPRWAGESVRGLIAELDALDLDFVRHMHLESHVLFPLALEPRS
jgi:regulator of cell morphogenesis and NO signaling